MREIENLKEHILKEYPRLNKDSSFKFKCHPGVPCFNDCCRDINIFLTPYDVIRLKTKLGITSDEFLNKYTIMPFDENLKYPIILLQMNENEKKTCQFVSDKGCTVYEDRPWACRMYPLGLASPKEEEGGRGEEFFFLLEEDFCKGFKEDNHHTVANWIEDQAIEEYDKQGEKFKELTLHKFFADQKNMEPQKVEMFILVCYNIDKFRDFIFKSSFFSKFEVAESVKNKMKEDDLALLDFGYNWLRFAIFGEPTMEVKNDVLEKQKELMKDQLKKKD